MYNPLSPKNTLISLALLLCQCTGGTTDDIRLEASCFDGIKNGDEMAADCGGSCDACQVATEPELPVSGYTSPLDRPGYSLVWSDEFDGETLEMEKWGFNLGNGCPALCDWGNNELQYFTSESENIMLMDGNLLIRAQSEFRSGKSYTSSRIHTDNKFEVQYGRIDIRASMPGAPGTWVALFMLNKDYTIDQPDAYWPSGGEIDIVEYLGEAREEVFGTAHFGVSFPENHFFESGTFRLDSGQPFDLEYAVYSIEWEEDRIRWLVNDQEYHSITPATTAAKGQPYPFNDAFYLVFALSVGGNITTVPPNPADFPSTLVVDYVRVFQKER